jgi:hypothetical protein
MIIQLNPPLPLRHISKGNFLAHFFNDPGIENLVEFTGFLDNGEIWTFTNLDLRAQKNITLGRDFGEETLKEKREEFLKSVDEFKEKNFNPWEPCGYTAKNHCTCDEKPLVHGVTCNESR